MLFIDQSSLRIGTIGYNGADKVCRLQSKTNLLDYLIVMHICNQSDKCGIQSRCILLFQVFFVYFVSFWLFFFFHIPILYLYIALLVFVFIHFVCICFIQHDFILNSIYATTYYSFLISLAPCLTIHNQIKFMWVSHIIEEGISNGWMDTLLYEEKKNTLA